MLKLANAQSPELQETHLSALSSFTKSISPAAQDKGKEEKPGPSPVDVAGPASRSSSSLGE